MTRTQLMLTATLFALAGLWGCSQSATADRAQQLEARVAKLEDDLKTSNTVREVLKTRIAALEEQVRAEADRARLIELERDALTAQLRHKIAEKDAVVANYDDLVKKLESVLGHAKVVQVQQADESLGTVPAAVTSFPKK